MSPSAVVVVHREAMVAEGIAAALGTFPEIVPIATATSVKGVEQYADHADAVAIDRDVRGAQAFARRLRRRGVRVVFVGHGGRRDSEVSTGAPISVLAGALVPGVETRRESGRLTLRERQVLTLVARGFAAKQVGRQLSISPKTVERHKTRIFAKLGVPNQAAAVSAAMGRELERSSTWMQLTS